MKNLFSVIVFMMLFNFSYSYMDATNPKIKKLKKTNATALVYQTIELSPEDDAYLQGASRYNSTLIRLDQGSRTGYLKFDTSSVNGVISNVELQLTISSDSGNGTITVFNGSHSNWTESNLTTSNAPSEGVSLGSSSSSGSGVHSYTLSIADQQIYGGDLSLVLVHTGTDDLAYASKEHATVSIRPKLIITYTENSADTVNPSSPTLSSTGETATTADLSWSGATDNTGVTGYKIFIDGSLEATLGNVSSYQVTGLMAATSYNFTATALDAADNESGASNTVSVTTNSSGGSDTEDPTAPTLSSTAQTASTADLSWSGATDNTGVTGYKIFKDGALEATLGNVSTYQVTGLTAATTYSFTATALDAAANESAISNALSITTNTSGGGGSSGNWTLASSNLYYNAGNVGIGTTAPGTWKLAVNGNIRAKEIKVETGWADYVFEKDYELPTLEEVERHIKEKGHLINIPSAEEVQANGIELGEMNKLLLEKIEELTLYVIDLKNENNNQQQEIESLKRIIYSKNK